ncbi:MAG: hypothetical protein GY845_35440 [Planctomycetes bacterium]|nr:hypothetical protein [Planctomycetota bacterium]
MSFTTYLMTHLEEPMTWVASSAVILTLMTKDFIFGKENLSDVLQLKRAGEVAALGVIMSSARATGMEFGL